MRCPHCSTAVAHPPTCRVCGSSLTEPAARQDTMPGLEPTSSGEVDADSPPIAGLEPTMSTDVDVSVEPMPGLITNDEALGDTRIPDDEVADVPNTCRRCGAAYTGGRFCERCGRTVPPSAETAKEKVVPKLICLECSIPNPQGQARCLACGARL